MRTSHVILLGGLLLLAGCGKKQASDDSKAKDGTAARAGATSPDSAAVTVANAPFAAEISARGFKVVQARRFPAQLTSRRAKVVVYQAADGASGGIVYTMSMMGDADQPVWHWRFADGAPDSIAPLEIDGDGLWDVRVYMKGGKTVEFVQDKDFTFRGPERGSLVALNGPASAPELWKVFDGDTATAWSSPASNAFIEVASPFGLKQGELTVRLASGNRPKKVTLVAGDSKQSFDLKPTAEEQHFALDAGVQAATSIRVEFDGKGSTVAISELGIR